MFNVEEELALFLRAALTTQYNHYYIGDIEPKNIPADHLPALIVQGNQTVLRTAELTTARDKYSFNLLITVVTNAYSQVQSTEPTNTGDSNIVEVKSSKVLKNLVEQRDSDGKPLDASVLGAMRNNVIGTDYLFSHDIVIDYPRGNVPGTQYKIATLTVQNVTRYNSR